MASIKNVSLNHKKLKIKKGSVAPSCARSGEGSDELTNRVYAQESLELLA
jgi:hypothetical protein